MTALVIEGVHVEDLAGMDDAQCDREDGPAVSVLTHGGTCQWLLCTKHTQQAIEAIKSDRRAWGCPKCGRLGINAIPTQQWKVRPI